MNQRRTQPAKSSLFISTKMSSFFRKKKPIIIRSQHHHQLFYHQQKKRGSTYECSGCQQPGFGPYYSCNDGCDLYYHPYCGELLSSDSSSAALVRDYPPYPTGDLVLKETAPHIGRHCIACGDRVRMLRYKWRHKKAHGSRNPYWRLYRLLVNRAFHPLCASLPAQMPAPGRRESILELMERIRGECLICKGKSKGWAYNSTCGVYGYHVGCVKKKVIQSWKQVEAPGNGGKRRKVTIYLKKVTLEIAKWALQQIIKVLFGLPADMVVDIIVKFFDFIYE